jgi:hypothetical protein
MASINAKFTMKVEVKQEEAVKEISPFFPAPTSELFATRGFFDPQLVNEFELDIPSSGWNGDFDHFNFMLRYASNPQKSDANAIACWQVLSRDDMDFLYAAQPRDDEYYENAGLNQKIGWLFNDATSGPPVRQYWKNDGEYRFGCMAMGHSFIRVREYDTFIADFPNDTRKEAKFAVIDGFRRMMKQPLGEYVPYVYRFQSRDYKTNLRTGVIKLLELGLAQICPEPNKARKISITNKGLKIHFPWDFRDWPGTPKGFYGLWTGGLYKREFKDGVE